MNAEIRLRQWFPYPLWDVWHTGYSQRYAGGFFTKRGARQWIADHKGDYDEDFRDRLDWRSDYDD